MASPCATVLLLSGDPACPALIRTLWTSPQTLARIIHERFCCNRGFAAATSLSAGGLAARSVDILFKDAFLPHASARPSRCATPHFRDEPS